MNCTACGHANREGAKFCEECATALTLACAHCGAVLRPTAKFCDTCAQPVAPELQAARHAAPAGALTRQPAPVPGAYTPKHLADKLLQSKPALEGERKQVTVLFADVKGSMELAEQLDPEEWSRIMSHFFQILSEGVERFEGFVDKFTGDGIMALFGAPIAHEDHAQRACWAALHLRDTLRRYADELRVERGLSFAVRMGINSGEVVVGKIGDDLRMDYTAQGHTVGLAQRMEQLADPGTVMLTEHTQRLAAGYFALRDLGAARVKGVAEPLHVFELAGTGPLRTRLDVSRARGFSRFVGRTAEMAALEAALERAIAGQGKVVGIVAEAGIGKSRLCHEFLERCRVRGIVVRAAHAVSHGQMIPFLPVLELLRSLFEIDERDSPRLVRHKVAGALLLLDRGLEPALPLVFDFLGVPDPERPSPPLPPDERHRQFLGVFRHVTAARSARQPGVILIEDLHWVDPGTEAFLAEVAEVTADARTLVVVNFRPGYRAPWMERSHYEQLALRPLGADAIAALLRDLLGDDPSLAGLAARIDTRTAGNPFFIEETVQALAEAGHLTGTKGAYRLALPLDRLVLPTTVHAVLAARIDRLPEREKQVLQAAAVIGKQFLEPVLRTVTARAEADLDAALRTLVAAELVYEQALFPERDYAFKHPLTQEVAYGSQLGERRARIHAAVAQALEARHRDALDAKAAELAHHWEQAGDAGNAVRWHRRAAELSGYAFMAQRVGHWEKVRDLAARLPSADERDAVGLAARAQLLVYGSRVGTSAGDMATLYRDGSEIAARTRNAPAQAQLLAAYGIYRVVGEGMMHEEVIADLQEAARRIDPATDADLQVLLYVALSTALLQRDPRALPQFVDETIARLMQDRVFDAVAPDALDPWGMFTHCKVTTLAQLGRLRDAADLVQAMEERARERGAIARLFAHLGACYVHLGAGRAPEALGHARQAAAMTEGFENRSVVSAAHLYLGLALTATGDPEGAERTLAALLARGLVPGSLEPLLIPVVAQAQLAQGDAARARQTAEQAVALAAARGNLVSAAEAHVVLARALVYTPSADASAVEAALAGAEALIDRTGDVSLLPQVLEVRAELAQSRGDQSARSAHLREALRLYTEMGATGHTERIESLLQ